LAGFPGTSVENRLVFLNEQKLPAVITAAQGESLLEFMDSTPKELEAIRQRYGAILFRGFDLRTAEDFHTVAAHCFGDTLRPYLGGKPAGPVHIRDLRVHSVPFPFAHPAAQ
jgi:hypothetical protein